MDKVRLPLKGKKVFLYFALFFLTVAVVNGVFIYLALSTRTGVVTEQPYEKGLAYDDVLARAKAQPKLVQKALYEGGLLRWSIADEKARPIEGASVVAKIVRPVQDGYDFEIALSHKGGGVYEALPTLPLRGLWEARLGATWNNTQYQTTYEFIVE